MDVSSGYVDLGRRFDPHGPGQDPEQAALRSYLARERGGDPGSVTWADLLSHGRAVVLAEARSGKTWEMLAQAGRLGKAGEAAFFARIELLASAGPDAAFGGPDDRARLARWLAGRGRGIFLLDAVDEARLRSHADFEAALGRLAALLGQASARAAVVITSRVSAWRGAADSQLVEARLGPFRPDPGPATPPGERPGAGTAETPVVKVVTLAALGRNQVEQFAAARLAGAAHGFLDALDRRDAWAVAGRPQDVDDLLRYWRERGDLGTLSDLVEFDVTAKLAERNPSHEGRASLDAARAREGAERLAGAATLARRFTIRLPGEGPGDAGEGLDPFALLPGWPAGEARALLGRALFDEAAYGAVRFHHRRTQEYLAARWLHRLLAAGLPRSDLRRLLFRDRYGQRVVPPSLGPVAAWLAGWDAPTRRMLLDVEPDLLLRHGDPGRLEVAERKRLLCRIAEACAVRNGFEDIGQLRRLAHPDLAGTVAGLLADTAVSDDVREMLLLLVREGRLLGCGEAALAIAADPGRDGTVRSYAVWALGGLGDASLLRRLADAVLARLPPPKRLADDLVTALYPDVLDEAGLGRLLSGVEAHPSRGEDLARALSGKLPGVPGGRLPGLLATLMGLARQDPHLVDGETGKGVGLCSHHTWTAGPIVEVLGRLLRLPERAGVTVAALADAVQLIEELLEVRAGFGEPVKDMASLLADARDVRREIFWRRVRAARREDAHPHMLLHGARYKNAVRFQDSDAAWLLRDAIATKEPKDAKAAVAAASWLSGGRRLTREESRLASALCRDRELRQVLRRYRPARLTRLVHRTRHQVQELLYKARRLRYLRRGWPPVPIRKLEVWLGILRNLTKAPGRVPWHVTYDAVFAFHEGDRRSQEDGDATLEHVKQRYGALVEGRVRAWLKAFWRHWLLFPESYRRDYRLADLALFALSVEVRGGLDWPCVGPTEASSATEIALRRLNSFPRWLGELHRCHPVVVEDALGSQIGRDFAIPADHPQAFGTLSKLAWDRTGLGVRVAHLVAARLSGGDPCHVDILGHALACLLDAGSFDDIIRLAPVRCDAAWGAADRKRFLLWMGTWLQVAAHAALDRLDAYLGAEPTLAGEIIEQLAAGLSGRHRRLSRAASPDFTRPDIARRLVPLVYRHVDPAGDRYRDGPYRPDQRDDAEDFRGQLLASLSGTPGEAAHDMLLALAADPDIPFLERTRLWLRDAARARAAEDAEDQPWTAAQVDMFDRRLTRLPETADALFDVVLARLDDIRDDAENGEFSPRGDFDPADEEEVIQRWLAAKFQDTGRAAYDVVREPEGHGRVRPDIKLLRAGISPTTVEVKWAHKRERSYADLSAALTGQLAEGYMRANRSDHGVLVLVNLDAGRRWRPSPGRQVDFPQLVAALDREAEALAKGRGRGERIRVVGIDLSPVAGW